MINTIDGWVTLLSIAGGAAAGGWWAYRSLHIARTLEDTPTSKLRAAAQGYVELVGRVRNLPDKVVVTPLQSKPCVWWSFKVEEHTGGHGRKKRWRTIAKGTSENSFVMDDGTGQCLIEPEDAQVIPSHKVTWYDEFPESTGPSSRKLFSIFVPPPYKFTEEWIDLEERVHLLGQLSTRNPSQGPESVTVQASMLIETWREDLKSFRERFDLDEDQRMSQEEWKNVEATARDEILAQHYQEPPEPSYEVITRPRTGQPYLISAEPQDPLVRRYRRRAVLGFIGFLIGIGLVTHFLLGTVLL